MKYYEVGKIINTHGIKGDLKIDSYSNLDRFKKGNYIYIGEEKEKFEIFTNRTSKGFEYISLKGYLDINLVLKYKGKLVYIDETQLGDLEEDEYFYHDLIGLEVYNEDNLYRGIVVGIRELPQGDLLEVEKKDSKIALIPFRKEFVLDVNEKIIIHEIEGLI